MLARRLMMKLKTVNKRIFDKRICQHIKCV